MPDYCDPLDLPPDIVANLVQARTGVTAGQRGIDDARAGRIGEIEFPRHLYIPRDGIPWFEQRTINQFGAPGGPGAANVFAEVVFEVIPSGLEGYLGYFTQMTTDFSPGLADEGIQWRLQVDSSGFIPWDDFRGLISTVQAPKMFHTTQILKPGQRLHLDARVMTTAEGGGVPGAGLDNGTVDITCAIFGWWVPPRYS